MMCALLLFIHLCRAPMSNSSSRGCLETTMASAMVGQVSTNRYDCPRIHAATVELGSLLDIIAAGFCQSAAQTVKGSLLGLLETVFSLIVSIFNIHLRRILRLEAVTAPPSCGC